MMNYTLPRLRLIGVAISIIAIAIMFALFVAFASAGEEETKEELTLPDFAALSSKDPNERKEFFKEMWDFREKVIAKLLASAKDAPADDPCKQYPVKEPVMEVLGEWRIHDAGIEYLIENIGFVSEFSHGSGPEKYPGVIALIKVGMPAVLRILKKPHWLKEIPAEQIKLYAIVVVCALKSKRRATALIESEITVAPEKKKPYLEELLEYAKQVAAY